MYALALPPGRWVVEPIPVGLLLDWGEPPWRPDVTVAAGEVVYAGEAYVLSACWLPRLEIHDQMARDLALLRAKNPAFDASRVEKRLLRFRNLDGA